jgi:uncharacterized membrane-anchored protein
MLDRSDQRRLDRNVEKRNNAVHRLTSVLIGIVAVVCGVITTNSLYVYAITFITVAVGGTYVVYLTYDYFVYSKTVRNMRRLAKQNKKEFWQGLDSLTLAVRDKN